MYDDLIKAVAAGYERIVAWADILDRINVYPVPDGDTGRNLVITLAPAEISMGISIPCSRRFYYRPGAIRETLPPASFLASSSAMSCLLCPRQPRSAVIWHTGQFPTLNREP